MSGRLIAVEGLDGVGKTTLSAALAEALDALWTTTPGAWIRANRRDFDASFMASPEARSLAYGATVIAAGREAERALRSGKDVVVDRYWLSTVAYAPHGVWEALAAMSEAARPADLTLYLSAPEALRRARLEGRGALSAADLDTLSPGKGRWLHQCFLAFRDDRVAGRFLSLDASADAGQVLRDALQQIASSAPSQRALFAQHEEARDISSANAPERRAI